MTIYYESELYHYGIKGQKWGVRRYQNKDGSLTKAGQRRYDRQERKTIKKANSHLTKSEYATMRWFDAIDKSIDYNKSGKNFMNKKRSNQSLKEIEYWEKQSKDEFEAAKSYIKQLNPSRVSFVSNVDKSMEESCAVIGNMFYQQTRYWKGDAVLSNKTIAKQTAKDEKRLNKAHEKFRKAAEKHPDPYNKSRSRASLKEDKLLKKYAESYDTTLDIETDKFKLRRKTL